MQKGSEEEMIYGHCANHKGGLNSIPQFLLNLLQRPKEDNHPQNFKYPEQTNQ